MAIAALHNFGDGVRRRFSSIPEHPHIQRAMRISPAISESYNLAVSVINARILSVFLAMVWTSSSATGHSTVASHSLASRVIALSRPARIGSVVAIPFALYNVFYEARRIQGKNKLDAVLRTMEAASWLSQSVSTFVRGLYLTGIGGSVAADCAFSFSAAGVILSSATIALNAKHLHESNKFLSKIESKREERVNILRFVGNQKVVTLEKYFNVNGDKLKTALRDIQDRVSTLMSSHREEEREEGIKLKDEAIEVLKKRIKTKNFSHKLAILSAAVTIIGMAILGLTPLAPLAYGLLAVGSAIALAKYFHEKKSIKEFTFELNRIKVTPEVELSPLRFY